jgi:hypothetical protein
LFDIRRVVLRHPGQNRHAHVDIVVDDHLALDVVETVQPAGILGKRAFQISRSRATLSATGYWQRSGTVGREIDRA